MNEAKEKVFNIYKNTINKIEDVTEYRVYRPSWLRLILTDMHNELRSIEKESNDASV